MNLSEPFIRRPVMAVLLMLPLIVFGIFAYFKLPVSALPLIESPVIQVQVTYPGASPEEMANFVAGPLERQFMLMQGIKFVASENDYQQTTIVLQFYDDVNIDIAAQNVQEAINQATGQLPKNLPNPPTYMKVNPSDTPIIFLNVYSDTAPISDIYEWAYSFIGQQLGTVEGIAMITTYGYPYAVRVQIDGQAAASRDLSLADIATQITHENPYKPTGKFYGKNKSIVSKINGQYIAADPYNDLIIKYEDGEPVRLRDIGFAYESVQNDKSSFHWVSKDGDETGTVILAIMKQQGYNTVKVCQDIDALLKRLKNDLPGSMQLNIPFSQSVYIQEAVSEVEFTLLIAFLLVIAVVYIYLGKFTNSLIPLITLPITITGTFMLMYVFGYSIDIMSMSALTLAIGFLIDDAIIVLENIVRHIQLGMSPGKGALAGSKQIIITVISISLCLCAVFIPMLFLQGAVGKIFHEFGAVMFIAILFSGFISISLTPMLSSRFLAPYDATKKTKMELFSEKLNEALVKKYRPILEWALQHRKTVFIFCLANLVLSFYLFSILPREFLPENDLGIIETFILSDVACSPERMSRYIEAISDIAIKNPAVDNLLTIKSFPTDNQALAFINLAPPNKRKSIDTVIQELHAAFDKVVGINVFLKPMPLINLQVGNITAGKANYQYILQGFYQDDVFKVATDLLSRLKKRPELAQVSSDYLGDAPVLDVDILRDAAHSYGNLTAQAIENAFMYAYGETYITLLNSPVNGYYVVLEATDTDTQIPANLSRLYVGAGDDQVAVESVIKRHLRTGPLEVNHLNALTSVTVAFNPAPDFSLSQAIKAVTEEADGALTAKVMGGFAGNTQAFKQTFLQLTILLIISIFIIYVILGVLYENFIHPFTALSALPVALFGGLLTLLIFRQAISIYALIGFIMLIGIVMKNGIIIIDFALEEKEQNKRSTYDAIVNACLVRFRPILMTTLAAMMGGIPVALGIGGTIAQGRAPLGMVVVGGLLFSQLVTLFVIPAFFIFICDLQERIQAKFKLFHHKLEE